MFRKFLWIFFLACACVSASAQDYLSFSGACPQWVWLNPYPDASGADQIFITRQGIISYIFGVNNGWESEIYGTLSRDSGKSWKRFMILDTLGDSLSVGANDNIRFVNDTAGFFVQSGSNHIYKSTDGGVHWFYMGVNYNPLFNEFATITENFWLARIVLYHNFSRDTGTIYATLDAGKNWRIVRTDTVGDVGGAVYPEIYFLDSLHGWIIKTYLDSSGFGFANDFMRTSDGGKTWTFIDHPVNFPGQFKFFDFLHGVCNEGATIGSFFTTTDAGLTWVPFKTQLLDSGAQNIIWTIDNSDLITVLAYNFPHLYYGTTTNNGTTWQRDSSYETNYTSGFYLLANGLIGVIGGGGLLTISADHGKTWSRNDQLFQANEQEIFFTNRNTGYILTDHGLFKTQDGGRNIKLVLHDSGGVRNYSHPTANIIWVEHSRSVDSGKTFQEVTTFPAGAPPASIYFVDSLYGWGFTFWNGIWKTTDGGVTWAMQRDTTTSNSELTNSFNDASMVDREYGWMSGDVFLRTTNGGVNWDTMNVNVGTSFSTHIYFLNHEHGFIYSDENDNETTDGGLTWHDMPVHGNPVHFRDSLFGWVGGNITTDGGKTWTDKGCVDFNFTAPAMYWWADSSEGWYAFGNYLFHYGGFDSATVGVAENKIQIPSSNILLENYPNPFSETTTLSFIISNTTNNQPHPIQLIIYNMLGERVLDLSSQAQHAGNNGEIIVHASGLPIGTYIAQLRAGSEMQTRRIVVTK